MNIKTAAVSVGLLASLCLLGACAVAPADGTANGGDDKTDTTEKTGAATQAVAASPSPCSWADMDAAQSACDNSHGWVGRTYVGCTITSCVSTSTTIYYTYTTAF